MIRYTYKYALWLVKAQGVQGHRAQGLGFRAYKDSGLRV